MTVRSVVIAGGGVGGLSAAWWLARAGWRPLVIERASGLRGGGYMLGLSGPGYDVAGLMGILPALGERQRCINENVYLDRDGKVLWRARYHELLGDIDWITLARSELVRVLYEALDDRVEVRFGVTVVETTQDADGVDVLLSDGSRCRAELVIGADGVHSSLRRQIFGPDASFVRPLGYRCAAFQADDGLGLGHDFLSYAEPGRLTEFYTLAEGRLATLYAWGDKASAPVPPGRERQVLKAAYEGAHPTVLRYLDELPEEAGLFFDDLEMIEMPCWSQGRVLLLGDAAHCLTLISGQGAGMAMTSACILAQELARAEVPAALGRHEARLRPSIQRLQARSRKIAPLFIPATPRAFALRNWIMRYMPPRLLAWYFARAIRSEVLAAAGGLDLQAGQRG
ncbi:MAG: FAD-dependent monooxygenase [Kiloniellaceae bacterium]